MTLPEIQQKKEQLIAQSKPRDAYNFGRKIIDSLLQNNIQHTNPTVYEQLLDEGVSCITYGLKYLSDEDFEAFVQSFIVHAIRNQSKNPEEEIDFIDRLKNRFAMFPSEYEVTYKEKLQKLIHKSQDTIGEKPLNISLEKSSEPPTVANWLAYYEKKHGDNYTDSFKRSQFLAGDDHVQNLDTQGRQDIQNLLTLMDFLQEYEFVDEYDDIELQSIESLSPPQPARETMSREILDSPVQEPNLSQGMQSQEDPQAPQPPFINESASDVMNQPPASPKPESQDPPKFLGQQPSMQPEKPQSPPVQKPSNTVDLSKVKLPDTRSKQTIDLKKLS